MKQCIMRAMGGVPSIKGFIETSFLDWPGKVASVIFLPGCNFRCPFCHNRSLVLTPQEFEDIPFEYVLDSITKHEGWLDGVVVTGGEPTLSPGFDRLLEAVKSYGLAVKLDTNGSNPEVLEKLLSLNLIDAVAMDIKAPLRPDAYERAAGVPVEVERIRESIDILLKSSLEVTFRSTVVPGLHDEAAVREMAAELHGRGLLLQNFRPADTLDPAYNRIKPFSPEELRDLQAAADGGAAGIYAYY